MVLTFACRLPIGIEVILKAGGSDATAVVNSENNKVELQFPIESNPTNLVSKCPSTTTR